jgi:hypothetical protein
MRIICRLISQYAELGTKTTFVRLVHGESASVHRLVFSGNSRNNG